MARTEESRRKVGERTKAYMASLTPEARRELSMKAVKAKLKKYPPKTSQEIESNRKQARIQIRLDAIRAYGGACA